MQKNQEKVAIYSRKSKFTGKGESIDNQIELCREYICLQNSKRMAQQTIVYEDEGFSGKNLDRPGFQKMMQDAHKHLFQTIVVYRLDRISRNIGDFSGLIEELGQLKIAFVSIKEQFDTGTPMGRAMMYIASVFSQLERETIAERIRDNMRELAKTGRWLGGIPPTGYRSESVITVTLDGKQKKACQLAVVEDEAQTVRQIYALFIQTGSLTKTQAHLMQMGVLTKNHKPFSRFAIKAILQNPVYLIANEQAFQYFKNNKAEVFSLPERFDGVCGILAYNRTDQKKIRRRYTCRRLSGLLPWASIRA